MQAVKQQAIVQKERGDATAERRTDTRYGFNPFKEINLYGPDGTPAFYVQPAKIAGEDGEIDNPYHRTLPKGQLIPFPTFIATRSEASAAPAVNGKPAPAVRIDETRTAADAIESVYDAYGHQGFTMLRSLQGLPQDQAFRIFAVVHPFAYSLGSLVGELEFGAPDRIDSAIDLVFTVEGDEPYIVQCLQGDFERGIAESLRLELLEGAGLAVKEANDILDNTEQSMTTRYSGGTGKSGPDSLDRYLAAEMGRTLPKLLGKKDGGTEDLERKVDFLVDKEVERSDKQKIADLEKELAAERAKNAVAPKCGDNGGLTAQNEPCQRNAGPDGRCPAHPE